MARVNGKKPGASCTYHPKPQGKPFNPYRLSCGATIAYLGQRYDCGTEHANGLLICSRCANDARGLGLEVQK